MQNNGYANLTPDGMKLLDAALSWAMDRELVLPEDLMFLPPTLEGATLTLTWTGTGTLQQAEALSGNPSSDWSDVTPQPPNNTHTVDTTAGPANYYRLVQ